MIGLESILAFKHELIISFSIFMLLFIFVGSNGVKPSTLVHLVNTLLLGSSLFFLFEPTDALLFNDMFQSNALIQLQKSILSFGLLLVSALSFNWLKQHKNLLEFYLLLLSSLLGMCFMLSSANLLFFYLGLELATIPLAAAANFQLDKRKSAEAAIKLILSSAFSSAILLLGVSFIYGICGSLHYAAIAQNLEVNMLSQFAFVLLFSGFAFKMSVVPFHLWTADVYEGSPVAVTAFLSVVSKSAIAFVFIQVLHKVFHNLEATYVLSLAIVSVVTVLIGNLFAMRQENIKRFLAFSSIAQVGYILFALIGSAALSQSAVIYFMLVYLVSNLAAFGVVGVISDYTGKENISDYKGFYQENKFLSWTLAIALFSLAGVPPTAGFFGKFFLLLAAASKGYYLLISFAALNMVVSFYYYLRVVKNIFMEKNETPILAISLAPITKIALIICLVGILLIGLYGPIYEYLASFTEVF